ncbi:MAG TPA: GAP family protein [Solirubrobacteraceae bacterium]
MLEVTLVVISLAVADSVNPVTIAVALYLASTDSSRSRLAGFAAGVFGVYALGGAVLILGPGQLLDAAATSADTRAFHIASILLGALLLIGALVLFRRRHQSVQAAPAVARLSARSALALGAAVTALDLPTAFPYFAALAAILGSGVATGSQLVLLAAFNVIYVLPLALILAVRMFAGERCDPMFARGRQMIDRVAPILLVALTAVTGGGLLVRGADGLLS